MKLPWATFALLLCTAALQLSFPAQAAPKSTFRVPPTGPSAPPSETETLSLEQQRMMIVSPPAPSSQMPPTGIEKPSRPNYYFYQQSFSAQLGAAWDAENEDPQKIIWLFEFKYMLPRPLSPHWELGLTHHSSQKSFFHFSRKFTFRERQAYRPHLILGLAHRPRAQQQLIGLVNFDNYLVRAGLGFEDLLKLPRSVRMDLSLAAGPQDILGQFSFGYSWAR